MTEPHPLSHGFDWADSTKDRRPPHVVTEEQMRCFDDDGFFVIENLLDDATLLAVTSETDVACLSADDYLTTLPDERLFIAEKGAITFAPNIALANTVLRDFVMSKTLIDVVADVIGPKSRLYHDQAVYKSPEKPRRFPWHQDNGYAFVSPENYLTIWIALSDATIESGCVWVAPGLHRGGTFRHHYVDDLGWEIFEEPPITPVAAPVRAGGAVIFSSLTPHLTGPNTSQGMRKAYIVQYIGADARRHQSPTDLNGTPVSNDERYPMVPKFERS